jgi:signal transduction histidine kinase/CheY-like chemotaxis protein/HAMP domain-containing protein
MIRSSLFLKLLSAILGAVALFSAAIYTFSVPLIEEKAYEIELNASRTILDNVFVMAGKINGSLEDQRAIIVDVHKAQLRDVVMLAASYLDYAFGRADRGEVSVDEARRLAFDGLRALKYGNNDYIWVTDYASVIQSHPDPEFHGRDVSGLLDPEGRPILPTIIAIAREKGEGFHTYPWQRLGESRTSDKLSYFIDLPHRNLVIGTGTYLDDIDKEVERRKAAAIDDLRQALRGIRIARTGYVYIFDAANNMIIHPNTNIEGTEFGGLPDPMTGRPIHAELKEAADRDRPLSYRWDKPSDPGNYSYEKISWVRHFKGFDWYIASSVYVEELKRSSAVLGDRLLSISVAVMALASALGYLAVSRLMAPIRRLAETAEQVEAGNLDVASGIHRNDEIGLLAGAFDGMIRHVRGDIETLDSRVRERTCELQEAEARQRLILDAIPAAIAYFGRDETIRFANRQWAALVRRDAASVMGLDLKGTIGRYAHASIEPHMARTWDGLESTFEYAFPHPDGRTVVIKTTLIPQIAADGAVVAMFVLALDISAEKETEARLMEAQRMKAVGQLSGGLAHDFNNLLSVILGNLAAARDRYGQTPGLDAYLEPAVRASRRGADITSRLLAFSRQQPLKPEPVEVRGLVREVAILLRRSLPSSITISVPDGDEGCWAIADPNQLENALINLALNARDAMPDGGRLEFQVGVRTVTEPLQFDETVVPDEYLEISAADTGTGFVSEALSKAFEPFFTTKRQGSGLGLSMVYGFVKQSRGYIHLDSTPGQGSAITILLPRAAPAPLSVPHDAAAPCEEGAPWQGQLALVVEDDADVRAVLRGQLVELGFSVLEASSGDEAVELIGEIDGLCLVVSDVMMPGISGIELARRIRAGHPAIRVVLASGFSFDTSADHADLVIIRKPWEKSDLVAAIGRAEGGAHKS